MSTNPRAIFLSIQYPFPAKGHLFVNIQPLELVWNPLLAYGEISDELTKMELLGKPEFWLIRHVLFPICCLLNNAGLIISNDMQFPL